MNVFPFCVFLIKFCFLFCFLHLVTVQKVHYLAVFLYALGFYLMSFICGFCVLMQWIESFLQLGIVEKVGVF